MTLTIQCQSIWWKTMVFQKKNYNTKMCTSLNNGQKNRQKINEDIEDFNNTVNNVDLVDM